MSIKPFKGLIKDLYYSLESI